MKRRVWLYAMFWLSPAASWPLAAQERMELETTIIRGNTEMPQIVTIVPWQDAKTEPQQRQTLVLHSLFGDLFEPVIEEHHLGGRLREVPASDAE